MHVRIRLFGKPDAIVVVESKLTKIEEFRRLVKNKTDIGPESQLLLYGGKVLEDGYTFFDYNIKLNDVIQLMVKAKPPKEEKKESPIKKKNDKNSETSDDATLYKDAESKLYSVGDLVDLKDKEHGAWFEGKIVRIVKDPDYVEEPVEEKPEAETEVSSKDAAKKTGLKKGIPEYFQKLARIKERMNKIKKPVDDKTFEAGLLYKIELSPGDDDSSCYCKLNEIRPRARRTVDPSELKEDQLVMVNYNSEHKRETGYWYDYKVDKSEKVGKRYQLTGTIYLGVEGIPQADTVLEVHDKVYLIEDIIPVAERTEEDRQRLATEPEKRSTPLNCLTCRDIESTPCRDCGCHLCSGKENPDEIILCDECNMGFHLRCLSPPLAALPEDDWYCPECKTDASSVVAPGAAKQAKKTDAGKGTRDWGRGMACVGKTKTCVLPPNHFGPIPGIEVGMCWRFRIQLSESGIHRPPVSGIHGRDVEGAYSIVLSGGYEDDYDNGDEFTYTGSGGRDLSGNKRTAEQSSDQKLTRENRALARSCACAVSEEGGDAGEKWREGKPVRVVRSYKMLKHFPQYAPKEGIRYDGIYKVVKYYPEVGKAGFRVWKYLLRRDDPTPAPWHPEATTYPIIYPDGYLEAEAEKKAQKTAQPGKRPRKRSGEKMVRKNKRRKTRTVSSSDTSTTENDSPKKTPFSIALRASKQKEKDSKEEKENDLPANAVGKKDNAAVTEAEMELIRADVQNKRLWDDVVGRLNKATRKMFLDEVVELFQCGVCKELPTKPTTTDCGHNFCWRCVRSLTGSSGLVCPCCRRSQRAAPEPNAALGSALTSLLPGYQTTSN